MSYLEFQELTKSYDGRHKAVDGISLQVAEGEFITFLGPSGSGKTTTLMMLAGFETPTQGGIHLKGQPLDPVPPFRRNIGMVFQNYALFPHMSVAENVGFSLRMRKVAAAETKRRVAAALDIVGLAVYAAAEPRTLSGGQQQRVALARALVFEPDLLLLDEPLGALDKNLREQMQTEIKRIHREVGITTIYVTHDQTEAMTMSDRIAVFNAGKIEQVGPPLEVYFRPLTRFVASFVGDSNILSAKVVDASEGLFEVEHLGRIRGPRADGFEAGRKVDLLLRPEVIRLADRQAACENLFEFEVLGIVNYGDSLLATGAAPLALRIRIPSHAGSLIAEGARLEIAWRAQDMHVIRK
ncbi:MAG: ABC transporter ATP-binding protein [Hyphomicrobiales bacterium]